MTTRAPVPFRASRLATLMAFALVELVGCMLDRTPQPRGKKGEAFADAATNWVPPEGRSTADKRDGGFDAAADNPAAEADASQPEVPPTRAAQGMPMNDLAGRGGLDASQPASTAAALDAAGSPMQPDASSAVKEEATPCDADELRTRADAYFAAMKTNTPETLRIHQSVRYTENARDEVLGNGIWRNQPSAEFLRHVLDVQECASVSQAVLSQFRGLAAYAVRLRYANGLLLDVEAQFVFEYQNLLYFDPKATVLSGEDPWTVPISIEQRASRQALKDLAGNYFESAVQPGLAPPIAAGCHANQNGATAAANGSCLVVPADGRFEQVRIPVIDTATGIVAAIALRRGYIGVFLFKFENLTLSNIEIIGGIASATTGW